MERMTYFYKFLKRWQTQPTVVRGTVFSSKVIFLSRRPILRFGLDSVYWVWFSHFLYLWFLFDLLVFICFCIILAHVNSVLQNTPTVGDINTSKTDLGAT